MIPGSLYLTPRFYGVMLGLIALFALGFAVPEAYDFAQIGLIAFAIVMLMDVLFLYRTRPLFAVRKCQEKLSLGDANEVLIQLENLSNVPLRIEVIDEAPLQFQLRDFKMRTQVAAGGSQVLRYQLRPVERGAYEFGAINTFSATVLGLLQRRQKFTEPHQVAVYPSYIQLRRYQLLAISDRLQEIGIKRLRRRGQSTEFDQIREYVVGDDIRTLNWKASARRNQLMVNQYVDERSQQVYNLIDKGRSMKMPFDGLRLIDYAVNASLVLSHVAISKSDKAGLITFADRISGLVPAQRQAHQMHRLQEALYAQTTDFSEANYERLYRNLSWHVRERSLLLLYTNFETLQSLQRQLPYLRRIAKSHLLVVVFFENTELRTLTDAPATNTKELYIQTIAQRMAAEKRQIVRELQANGIHAVLTAPEHLTVSTINKYLEIKARGLI